MSVERTLALPPRSFALVVPPGALGIARMSPPESPAERRDYDCGVLVRALKDGGTLGALPLATPCGLVSVNGVDVRYSALPDVLSACKAAAASGRDTALVVAFPATSVRATSVSIAVANPAAAGGSPKAAGGGAY